MAFSLQNMVKHKRRSIVRKLFDESRFSIFRAWENPTSSVFTTKKTMASFDSISAAIGEIRVPGSAKGASRSAIKGVLSDVSAARVNLGLKKVGAKTERKNYSTPSSLDCHATLTVNTQR